jgi:regulator of sirC expression with transglutaminase-like and TPR domain
VIDEEDCQERLDNSYGGQVPLSPEHLRAATPREILVRMLTNLKANYLRRNLPREALAASERILLLNPRSLIEHRDRGLLLSQLGRPGEALAELKLYLRSAAETDPERAQVREALKAVHLKIASLN